MTASVSSAISIVVNRAEPGVSTVTLRKSFTPGSVNEPEVNCCGSMVNIGSVDDAGHAPPEPEAAAAVGAAVSDDGTATDAADAAADGKEPEDEDRMDVVKEDGKSTADGEDGEDGEDSDGEGSDPELDPELEVL